MCERVFVYVLRVFVRLNSLCFVLKVMTFIDLSFHSITIVYGRIMRACLSLSGVQRRNTLEAHWI
jgi:hypothetical protein